MTSGDGTISRQRSGLSPTRATNGMTIPVNGSDANAPASDASADVARVLLDSTVLIDALRGRPAGEHLRALRRQGDEPWTLQSRSRRIGADSPTTKPRNG